MHTIKPHIEDNMKEYSLAELYKEKIETKSFSNHSGNLIEEWKNSSEDDIWK